MLEFQDEEMPPVIVAPLRLATQTSRADAAKAHAEMGKWPRLSEAGGAVVAKYGGESDVGMDGGGGTGAGDDGAGGYGAGGGGGGGGGGAAGGAPVGRVDALRRTALERTNVRAEGAAVRMARRPHDDGDVSWLSEAWVRETVDGRVRYTNCVTGATQHAAPPVGHIVMKPSDYNREMRTYQKYDKSFSFFKRPRPGIRAPCIGVFLQFLLCCWCRCCMRSYRCFALCRRQRTPHCSGDFLLEFQDEEMPPVKKKPLRLAPQTSRADAAKAHAELGEWLRGRGAV